MKAVLSGSVSLYGKQKSFKLLVDALKAKLGLDSPFVFIKENILFSRLVYILLLMWFQNHK